MATWALWVLVVVLLLNGLVAGALVWTLRDMKSGSMAIALTGGLAFVNFLGAGYCLAAIVLR